MNKLILFSLLILLSCKSHSPTKSESRTPAQSADTDTTTTQDSWTQEFMELVNEHRGTIGLNPLTEDTALSEIVKVHAEEMAQGKVPFGHDGFSARCSGARNSMNGGNWCGENVAMGQKSPKAAFDSWMKSTGHKANIEKSRATHTGFGYAKSAKGTYYWVQLFLEL